MIHENVELHNVAEVRQIEGRGGVRLQRVPEEVRLKLNPGAQQRMLSPANAEIRFVHLRDFGDQFSSPKQKGTPEEYRQKLREAVQACPHPNVHLLEGPDILTDIGGLSADLIHPADNGMIQMGENLARKLQELIPA